jgi:8-oxo-dGTP pyrophosphatase MutT (NUDIX family)
MHRRELLRLLHQHRSRFMEEAAYVKSAIDFIYRHENVFDRHLLPAHVTGSAWVVNLDREQVLLLHHRKHSQWFQPGGHADGDADIVRVAVRECAEETGLESNQIHLIDASIFDVDIHTIPAMRDVPQHEHIDVRFVVEVDNRLAIPGNHESNAIAWLPLNQVLRYNNNRSTYRMLEKTRSMRNTFSWPLQNRG